MKDLVMKMLSLTDEGKKAAAAGILCGIMEHMDEDCEREIYELIEGKVLTEGRARDLISHMKPTGMKWELTETEAVRAAAAYDSIRPVDFWIVMNSAYNDYHDLFNENIEYYQKFAYDFICDEDAVEDKVYYYFTMIPKKDSE